MIQNAKQKQKHIYDLLTPCISHTATKETEKSIKTLAYKLNIIRWQKKCIKEIANAARCSSNSTVINCMLLIASRKWCSWDACNIVVFISILFISSSVFEKPTRHRIDNVKWLTTVVCCRRCTKKRLQVHKLCNERTEAS